MPTPEQLADRLEPEFRQALLAMIAALSRGPSASALEAALEAGDLAAVIRLFEVSFGDAATTAGVSVMVPPYQSLLRRSGTSTLRALGLPIAFEAATATAEDWIHHRSATMVQGIAEDALVSLRAALGAGYRQALGSRYTARQIRHLVGLVPSHAGAVVRYTEGMIRQGVPPERVAHFSQAYAQRLLNWRADAIARTETMTAAHAGQYEAWRQAFAQGLYRLHETWVEWVVTEDDRLCPKCAPMDGKRVRYGEFFVADVKGFPEGRPDVDTPGSRRRRQGPIRPDPLGQPRDAQGRFTRIGKRDGSDRLDGALEPLRAPVHVLHPPLHPQCRCAMRLRFDDGLATVATPPL